MFEFIVLMVVALTVFAIWLEWRERNPRQLGQGAGNWDRDIENRVRTIRRRNRRL